jgi:hypothetical protein
MLATHTVRPSKLQPTRDAPEATLRAKRRIVDVVKEAGRLALILGLFGAVLAAIIALKVAIWVPFFHR